jgi:formate dehydrogenase major subunit
MTINGRPVRAVPGQTVMEAARASGIHIPGLCDHPELKPEGACRLCMVDIEKQRTLQPACTFPVAEGLVIQTDTPKVVSARKFALQMLFSERSHYCMYCPASGTAETTDCELQRLGYQYGLNYWEFTPDYAKPWPVDASRKYFVMDHSRCILCRRCIRACDAIAANHTLGVAQRGARTMICADDDVPFGESTCISCGTCLQVCPTGALMDRRSAYMGHDAQVTRTRAVCLGCAVGCGIEAITRDNQLLRVEGDWDAANGGLLCDVGRFEAVESRPPRILTPLVRKDWRLVEASWKEALAVAAEKLRAAQRVAGLASPRLPNEALAAFACFFQEVLASNDVALLYGEDPPLDLGRRATLLDLAASDCIVVIGGEPLKNQKVVGSLIKRAYDNGARIIVVDDAPTGLDPYASQLLPLQDISYPAESPFERLRHTYHLRVSGVAQIKAAVQASRHPVVLYGTGLSTTVYSALRMLPDKAMFLPLVTGTNTAGAARLGLHPQAVHGEALYVLMGDDLAGGQALPQRQFTVVQAAYRSALTESADVVLPARIWAEQKGHVINLEGRSLMVAPLLEPPGAVWSEADTLLKLAEAMGYGLSFEPISEMSMA